MNEIEQIFRSITKAKLTVQPVRIVGHLSGAENRRLINGDGLGDGVGRW